MIKTRFPLRAYLPLLLLATFILLSTNKNASPQKEPSMNVEGIKEQLVGKPVSNFEKATVTKVVDGDTITVLISGKKETVRIIGINTPEIVDPRRKVECFGKESSARAVELLSDKTVELEKDESQSDRDKYARLLRYVWVDGKDFGKEMINDGFAYEYTYDTPYKYQTDYKRAQKDAQEKGVGLWAEGVCKIPL